MNRIHNSRTERFIGSISPYWLKDVCSDITQRCKFNFSYFDANQKCSTDLSKWDEENLQLFFDKLKAYSQYSLAHWQKAAYRITQASCA